MPSCMILPASYIPDLNCTGLKLGTDGLFSVACAYGDPPDLFVTLRVRLLDFLSSVRQQV